MITDAGGTPVSFAIAVPLPRLLVKFAIDWSVGPGSGGLPGLPQAWSPPSLLEEMTQSGEAAVIEPVPLLTWNLLGRSLLHCGTVGLVETTQPLMRLITLVSVGSQPVFLSMVKNAVVVAPMLEIGGAVFGTFVVGGAFSP